jgi:DNA-directed RNA polymerase specialized sigma24 family protein
VRAIFRLHRVNGLDFAAIAQLWGEPMDEIERQIAEALVLIGQALDTDEPAPTAMRDG